MPTMNRLVLREATPTSITVAWSSFDGVVCLYEENSGFPLNKVDASTTNIQRFVNLDPDKSYRVQAWDRQGGGQGSVSRPKAMFSPGLSEPLDARPIWEYATLTYDDRIAGAEETFARRLTTLAQSHWEPVLVLSLGVVLIRRQAIAIEDNNDVD